MTALLLRHWSAFSFPVGWLQHRLSTLHSSDAIVVHAVTTVVPLVRYKGCETSNFHYASLPDSLYNLTNLKELYLEYTCTGGSLSPLFGQLRQLQIAKLHCNHLSGGIPKSMEELTQLLWWDLGRNPLTGPIPNLSKSTGLQKFSCNFCALTGKVPDIFGSFPHLIHSFWDGNGLSGSLPPSLGALASIQGLSFDINNLTGPVPAGLCRLSALVDCRIGHDTNYTAYLGDYSWMLAVVGNIFDCPLPPCATGSGTCNHVADCHPVTNPCSPVICRPPR